MLIAHVVAGVYGVLKIVLKLGFRHTHDELYPPTGRLHPSYLLTASDYFAEEE